MKKILQGFLWVLLMIGSQAYAQNRTVTGTVTSKDDGLPVPGVSVKIKGTQTGTQTGPNGTYSLSVPASSSVLTFSFIGFTEQSLAVPASGSLNVILASNARELDAVVVSAGGLSVTKGSQGYSTTSLKTQDITQGKTPSVAQALSGKVAGLQVNVVSSGVNPNVRLVLRGNRSLLGNNQALVVLDKVIVPNSILARLNPEDIEDIQVLNGPGAAALYGSDASNGAVLITTKKGKKGAPPSVRFSNTTSLEQVSFFPKMQNRFGSGSSNDIQEYIPFENQQYGPAFDGSLVQIGRPLQNGSIETVPYSATDSKNKFWETGLANQTDFSLSSADEKSTIFMSGQYFKQEGTTPDDRYNRLSLRLNGTRDLGNKVSIEYNANYVQERSNTTTETGNMYDQLLQTPDQIDVTRYKDWRNNPFANPNGYYNEYYANPYYTKDNNRQQIRNDNFTGKLELNWKPIDVLSFTGRVGISTTNQSYKSYVNKFVLDPYTASIGTSSLKRNNIPGSVEDGSSYATTLITDFLGTYKKQYNDLNVAFTVGTQLRNNNDNAQTLTATGLIQRDLFNAAQRYTPNTGGAQSNNTRRQIGVYGDLNLGYKDYLTLHATGRNDWTSVLARDNRSFFYPAVDVAFVPTNAFESLKNSSVLSSLKVRASLSRVGQANIGAYAVTPAYGQAAGYPFSTGPGYRISNRLVAPSLKPEITKAFETGVDADLYNGRISTSLTYYTTSTSNQTVPTGVSNATGFTQFLTNTGIVDNNGVEATVNFVPVKTLSGFQWSVGGNYTYNNNKVVEISSDLNQVQLNTGGDAQTFAATGMVYPVLFGSDYLRDDQGRVIVDRTTGYPSANPSQVYLGNTNPKHRLGLNTEFRYKNIRLYALAEYRGGFVIYNNGANAYDFSGASERTVYYNRERFVFPNSSYLDPATGQYVANTNVTVADGGAGFFADNNRNRAIASNYIYNGASWKLREVSISYDLPKSLLAKQKYIKGATISVQGRNLALWLPKSNIYTDPEFNFSDGNAIGITTLGQTPPTRFFGATLSVIL
jgi:TonB-linked SusC/RagA family outer membrane protein